MANYNSFVFEGHGYSEVTGGFDPGAVNGSVTENALADSIVKATKKYLDPLGLSIHYDENNYTDDDLRGNTYTAKCGIVVHINAGKGVGVEAYVPSKEKYLNSDFELCKNIGAIIGANRGVKSRDYNSEKTFTRTNGVALSYTDYYKEIRQAWEKGISLTLLEVGFIDSSDLSKIMANIDKIGYYCAKWVADNCGKTLPAYSTPAPAPTPTPPTNTGNKLYRVMAGSYSKRENAEAQKAKLIKAGFDATIMIFDK